MKMLNVVFVKSTHKKPRKADVKTHLQLYQDKSGDPNDMKLLWKLP